MVEHEICLLTSALCHIGHVDNISRTDLGSLLRVNREVDLRHACASLVHGNLCANIAITRILPKLHSEP